MEKSGNSLLLLLKSYQHLNCWIPQKVDSKDWLILPYCLPFGKAGGLQILRCKGIEVK
jgi:hypothetical protein